MGGGLGVSIHGSHRVGADSLILAMPETGIGFYPDIGASYFLPRCPGKFGWYLGLTGEKINAYEAHYLGLIDFVIAQSDFAQVIAQLTEIHFEEDAHNQVSQLLKSWQLPLEQSALLADQEEIDYCFSATTIDQILNKLKERKTQRSEHVLSVLKDKSPTSLKITLQLLDQGAQRDFDSCMDHEFKLTRHFLQQQDFYEGVRAAVIDKDRRPKWEPARLEDVDDNLLNQWGA
jgi:enoyl-CoA hydratase/carnithine racemase